ncbi:MAG: FAD-binding oxidoreductase [Thermomicrobiales bacterium]
MVAEVRSTLEEMMRRVRAVVGVDHARLTGPSDGLLADWWPLALKGAAAAQQAGQPLLIVQPADAIETAAVLRLCAESQIPVTAGGGGSGVVGAAVPGQPGVLLSMQRLDRIGAFSEIDGTIVAGAGTIGGEVERWLRERGRTLGFLPRSLELSSVGGWVATGATGAVSGRYGGVAERVVSLEVALTDGTLVKIPAMPRWGAGPDPRALFIGSEGTLGVVTEVTFAAPMLPASRLLRALWLPTLTAGLETLRESAQSGIGPASVALYDENETARHRELHGKDGPGCLLLFACEGRAEMAAAQEQCLQAVAAMQGASALPGAIAEKWDAGRQRRPEWFLALRQAGALADSVDIQAPWSKLEPLHAAIRQALAGDCDTVSMTFPEIHETGACCMVTFTIAAGDDTEAVTRYARAWETLMRVTLANGGAIAHHHGIGLARAGWLAPQLGEAAEPLRRLKRGFDPGGLLNPGKLPV